MVQVHMYVSNKEKKKKKKKKQSDYNSQHEQLLV